MLIQPNKSLLLVIDVQDKLLAAMPEPEALTDNIRWICQVAKQLGIPTLATEQYPEGLGGTQASIAEQLSPENILSKMAFSAMLEPGCHQRINQLRPSQVIIAGLEAHVCVLQTAIALKKEAREVYVLEDCIQSRNPNDKALAMARLRDAGVFIVSREMVAFEWLQTAKHPEFKAISKGFIA
ncbi:MAG: isochorismatase family protein [Pontibacterium sp.]